MNVNVNAKPRLQHPERRRALMAGALGVQALVWPSLAGAHESFGPVRPERPVPALRMTDMSGRATDLATMLSGHATALQLIYTGCSATCPIQGALFAQLQGQLGTADADARLLSVSIDPLGDDVKALRSWLDRHGARSPRWTAALPHRQDVDRLLEFLRGGKPGADRHTAQAFLFDGSARLVFRTEELPAPEALARLLRLKTPHLAS